MTSGPAAPIGVWPTRQHPPLWRLAPKGSHIHHRFDGTHRLVLTMTTNNIPQLSIESRAAPAGEAVLFCAAAMNNWASLDDYAFTFHCDAYYSQCESKRPARIQDRRCKLDRRRRPGVAKRASLSRLNANAQPDWPPARTETRQLVAEFDGEHAATGIRRWSCALVRRPKVIRRPQRRRGQGSTRPQRAIRQPRHRAQVALWRHTARRRGNLAGLRRTRELHRSHW